MTRSGFPREDKISDAYLKVQVPQAHTSPEVHATESTGISNAKLFTFVCMARAWLKLHFGVQINTISLPDLWSPESRTRLIPSCFSSSGLPIFRIKEVIYLHYTLSGSSGNTNILLHLDYNWCENEINLKNQQCSLQFHNYKTGTGQFRKPSKGEKSLINPTVLQEKAVLFTKTQNTLCRSAFNTITALAL